MGWFASNAPAGADQIVSAYQQYLGRTPSDAEVQSHLGPGANVAQSVSNIAQSPEARSYGASADTGGSTPAASTPAATTPSTNQNWDEGTFAAQFGRPGTPQELIALEPKLAEQGIKVLRNAEGTAGKIQLPNGQIVDVILSAGLGGRGFSWQTGSGGGQGGSYSGTFTGGGQYPLASVMGEGLMQPWTTRPRMSPSRTIRASSSA
jgi:hypothetical protein